MGRFYLFLMQLTKILVTVLCLLGRIETNVHRYEYSALSSPYPVQKTCRNPQMHPTLIVLIPSGMDTSSLSHQIWQLANAVEMQVLLLGLVDDEANEPGIRRGMVTLSAMLQRERIPTDMKIEARTNWVEHRETTLSPR